jgi:hypothetical protein
MNGNNRGMEDGSGANRKRKRKNTMQLKILKAEYAKNKEWSKELITKISEMTGLTESQIYKWNWDQKKKEEDEAQNPELSTKTTPVNVHMPSLKKLQLDLRMSQKENIDLSSQNFKLVGLQNAAKTKFHIQNRRKLSITLKNSKKGAKMSPIECEKEMLGKRKPFGQVNDSRVNSQTKARRYKQVKI